MQFTSNELYILLNQPGPLWLTSADLSEGNLMFSDLTGANLVYANLVKTNLSAARLSGANLSAVYVVKGNGTKGPVC